MKVAVYLSFSGRVKKMAEYVMGYNAHDTEEFFRYWIPVDH